MWFSAKEIMYSICREQQSLGTVRDHIFINYFQPLTSKRIKPTLCCADIYIYIFNARNLVTPEIQALTLLNRDQEELITLMLLCVCCCVTQRTVSWNCLKDNTTKFNKALVPNNNEICRCFQFAWNNVDICNYAPAEFLFSSSETALWFIKPLSSISDCL